MDCGSYGVGYIYSLFNENKKRGNFEFQTMEAMEFLMLMAVLVNLWLEGTAKNETSGAECMDDSN